jgi:hypothetical protein
MADGKAILTEEQGGTQEAQEAQEGTFLCFLCSAFLLATGALPHDVEALVEAIHQDNRSLVGPFAELLQ